jgi:hypothetical protein
MKQRLTHGVLISYVHSKNPFAFRRTYKLFPNITKSKKFIKRLEKDKHAFRFKLEMVHKSIMKDALKIQRRYNREKRK